MEHICRSTKRQFVEKRLIFVSTISRSKMKRAKLLVKMMKFHGSKIFECEFVPNSEEVNSRVTNLMT